MGIPNGKLILSTFIILKFSFVSVSDFARSLENDITALACGGSHNDLNVLIHKKNPQKLIFVFEGFGGYVPVSAQLLRNNHDPKKVPMMGATTKAYALYLVATLMPLSNTDTVVLYFAHDDWTEAADCAIALSQMQFSMGGANKSFHNLIALGFSNGGRSVFQWAKKLEARGVQVAAAFTVDPVRKVGEKLSFGLESKDAFHRQPNVKHWENYFQRMGGPGPIPSLFEGGILHGKLPSDYEVQVQANHLDIAYKINDRVLSQLKKISNMSLDNKYVRASGVSPTSSCAPNQEERNLDEMARLSEEVIKEHAENSQLSDRLYKIAMLDSNEAKVDAYASLVGIRRQAMSRNNYLRELAAFTGMRNPADLYARPERYVAEIRRYEAYVAELEKQLQLSNAEAKDLLLELHRRFAYGFL